MRRKSEFEFSSQTIKEAKRRAGNACEECRKDWWGMKLEAHHVIPIALAYCLAQDLQTFINSIRNCQILCPGCHHEADRLSGNIPVNEVDERARIQFNV